MSTPPCIAIVDDDAFLRDALQNLLRSAGFEALTFPSASAYLNRPQGAVVQALLTDYWMPGMNGIELAFALRAGEDRTPVVIMTAHEGPLLERMANEAGVAGLLIKPFEADLLIDTLEKAIEARHRAGNGAG